LTMLVPKARLQELGLMDIVNEQYGI